MDSLTNSLNSQMRMLEINKNSKIDESINDTNQTLSKLTLQVNNNFSMKFIENDNDNNIDGENLPNDINSLKNLLEMRIKYTRPKQGKYWEFTNIPNDVKYLQDAIRFIDKHCIKEDENNITKSKKEKTAYDKYLLNLELTPEQLDLEFGTRFYNHFSFNFLIEELINLIESSNVSHLSNLIRNKRIKGQVIPNSWIIFPNNLSLTQNDYIRYYDIMDENFKNWILNYCIIDKYHRNLFSINNDEISTFEILLNLINSQNKSLQIRTLINILIENIGSEEYLNQDNGFLPYITYIAHLQHAIINSIPNCQNPFRTIFILMIVIKGMVKYPILLNEFSEKIEEFLTEFPDFTLSELAEFLKKNNMNNINGIQRIGL